MDEHPDSTSATPSSPLLRVAVWAQDPLVQAGLVAILDGEAGVEVALDDDLEVDVVLWDADGALDPTPPLADEEVPVVAVVADLDRSTALLAQGVAGVMSRRGSAASLMAGLRAAVAGFGVVPLANLRGLLPEAPAALANLPLDPLTAREQEVLALVAEGLTNRGVATRLEISESTVKFHLNTLMSKFAAESRTELVVRAIQTGDLLI